MSALPVQDAADLVSLGFAELDTSLGGGLCRSALHEVYAANSADMVAATGFVLGVATKISCSKSRPRPLLWIRQDFLDAETGHIHPYGLSEFGIDPSNVIMVRVKDFAGLLKASAEATRCSALGCVIMQPWGEKSEMDLTTSRRLAMAAKTSGVASLLLRISGTPNPSAAKTRWRIRALPSQALAANAPGHPAFALSLLRHRDGITMPECYVEWNRDNQSFQPRHSPGRAPLPSSLVSAAANRPASTQGPASGLARAG
eukprot:gene13165-13270_t